LRLLSRSGAISVQGHLLSRPLAAEDVPVFARNSARQLAALLAGTEAESGGDAVVPFRTRN